MRRLVLIISVIVSAVLLLADCKSQNQTGDIPYTVCEGYFVRNDADKVPLGKITSQSEFDKLFGMAAVMGRSITPIDFSKQFVIAVSEKAYRKLHNLFAIVACALRKWDCVFLRH